MTAKEALTKAATLTFEELGFLLVAEDEGEPPEDASAHHVEVGFVGPVTGKILLVFPAALARQLTQNMLGQEEIPSEEETADALGEAANVICGNALPMVFGAQAIFNLTAPRICDGPNLAYRSSGEMIGETDVRFEEGSAEIAMFLEAA